MTPIQYEETIITPNGHAYLDNSNKYGFHYTTLATDETGREYRLIWLVTDESLMFEADECCDWLKPDFVVAQ